ncbi:hypothetical protein TNCV_1207731 [Trichonephila clavipes]|nr:hypothetical protein TNCV_1207731 [Trichonephila clavipes]
MSNVHCRKQKTNTFRDRTKPLLNRSIKQFLQQCEVIDSSGSLTLFSRERGGKTARAGPIAMLPLLAHFFGSLNPTDRSNIHSESPDNRKILFIFP